MAIINLSKENFTRLIVQISLYLSVLKQFTLSEKRMKPCRYQLSCKQCRSRSAGFTVDPDQLASEEAS